MKIGILTHHYVGNFGAVLQTDALVRVLKENCGDAEIEVINYKVLNHYFRSILDRILGFFIIKRKTRIYHIYESYNCLNHFMNFVNRYQLASR